ncbi:uncharacterized protein LOC108137616 isoform X2 [Drosophila elegans]|uniref:uncharacterized protein LOC108137616 isoform X2 n=1 Tax=Drosophila elegans TaxID=30023 RepID=UPI0007E89206|nr:uncharacterized protein LOC108137616 isoform X2 [Drosophila elegans]
MGFYLEHVMTGDRVYLVQGINLFGRHSICNWKMKYDYMSRFHALISVQNDKVFIREDARNGVFINYSQDRLGVIPREIFEGDDLSFGVKLEGDGELELPVTFGIFTLKAD